MLGRSYLHLILLLNLASGPAKLAIPPQPKTAAGSSRPNLLGSHLHSLRGLESGTKSARQPLLRSILEQKEGAIAFLRLRGGMFVTVSTLRSFPESTTINCTYKRHGTWLPSPSNKGSWETNNAFSHVYQVTKPIFHAHCYAS
jgi:hypothetical protein